MALGCDFNSPCLVLSNYRCVMPHADRPGLDDIGQRMTIRMHHPEGGYRDILGTLESPTSIRKRDGTVVHFAPDEIAIWRKIPPPIDRAGRGAPLSLRIREMELAANATWPAGEQVALGDWILRATGKFTMRANSALALGNPDVDLQEAIKKVIDFYEARNLTPVIHIALPTYADLDAALEDLGWQEEVTALVMVRDIEFKPLESSNPGIWESSDVPSDEWSALQDDHGVREIMLRAPAIYASLKIDGELIAVGRTANFEKWTTLTRLFVRPDYRGRGYGKDLVQYLLNEAYTRGATKALLQVNIGNTGAIQLYKNMGFKPHHTYKYRSYKPAPTQTISTHAEC